MVINFIEPGCILIGEIDINCLQPSFLWVCYGDLYDLIYLLSVIFIQPMVPDNSVSLILPLGDWLNITRMALK